MDTEKKETKEINKLSLLVVAVVVLALIVGGSVYYILHQRKQIDEMTQSFDLEKEMMEDDLNEISLQYEGYKFNVSSDYQREGDFPPEEGDRHPAQDHA